VSAADETTTDVGPDQSWRERPLGVLQSGGRYLYGFGPDYYGIWDIGQEGKPSERFPANQQGKQAGWERYLQLEPGAQRAPEPGEEVEFEEPEQPRHRLALIVGGVVVLAIVALIVARSGGGGGAGGGAGVGGTTAHVDIEGDLTHTEDLTETTYEPQNLSSLFAKFDATWTGPTTTLRISITTAHVGANPTSLAARTHLWIDVKAAGATTATQFTTAGAECTITVDTLQDDNLTGSFTCTGIKDSSGSTVDATGTFTAS
jgi:hypothetical protein